MSVPSVHIAKGRRRTLLMGDRRTCTPDMSEVRVLDVSDGR